MQHRLYFLMPDVASARRVMNDLLLARITERHIHFVSKPGIDLTGLHEANILQTSDIVHATQNGLVIGGGAGVLAGIVAALFPVIGEGPQWGMVGITTVVGALFGAWASSMIGSSVPNSRLKPFKQAVEDGQILLMVDVPRSRVSEIRALLQKTHPEGRFSGEDAAMPAFP
ncbi:UNVERIFIED_CONTAM: membrane protein [Mumia flava]